MRARALAMWEVAAAHKLTVAHADRLPAPYRRLRVDEGEASAERTLDTVVVPGLLQTAAYAEAISHANRAAWRPGWDARVAVAERRDRQALLTRDERPLRLHALLDEVVLRRPVGGPGVLAGQLDHLVAMSRRPNVTVQVVPLGAGAHGALSGPLVLLGFPEEDERDAAYVESLTGMATVDDEKEVARLSALWVGVAARALPVRGSVAAIRAVRAEGP